MLILKPNVKIKVHNASHSIFDDCFIFFKGFMNNLHKCIILLLCIQYPKEYYGQGSPNFNLKIKLYINYVLSFTVLYLLYLRSMGFMVLKQFYEQFTQKKCSLRFDVSK